MTTAPWSHRRLRSALSPLLLFALGAAALAGCGGAPAPQDPTQLQTPDVIGLLPPDAEGVIVVDVAAVRSASFVARLDEAIQPSSNEELARVRELLNRIDRVAVAFRHEPADESGEPLVIVMRGSFGAADLDTFAPSQTPDTHREHALRRDGPMVLALAGDHTLVFGNDRWVLAALDRLDGLSPAAGPASAVLVDAAQRVQLGQHTVTFASEVSRAFRTEDLEQFPMRANAVSLGGLIDLSDPIRLQAFGLFTDDDSAAAMAAALLEKVAEGQQSPELAAAGLERLFEGVNVAANGPVVDVTYSLDSQTFERVIVGLVAGFQAFSTAAMDATAEEPAESVGSEGAPASDVHVTP